LQLDISKSNFEMIVDSIASGLDPSASNYITSSSYSNGYLVRQTGEIGAVSATTVVSTSTGSATIPSTTTVTSTTGTSSAFTTGTTSSRSSY